MKIPYDIFMVLSVLLMDIAPSKWGPDHEILAVRVKLRVV